MFHSFISNIAIPALINIICAIIYDAYKKSSVASENTTKERYKYTRKYVMTCRIQGVLGLVLGIVLLLCGIFSTDDIFLNTTIYTMSFFSFFLSYCGTECLSEAAKHFLDIAEADSDDENVHHI